MGDFVSVSRAAELCGVTDRQIRYWIEKGALRSARIGGRRLVRVSDLSSEVEGSGCTPT